MELQGFFENEYENIIQEFLNLFNNPEQKGASLTLYHKNYQIINISKNWPSQSLVNIFSCSKPILSIFILKLAQLNEIDLSKKLNFYWKEWSKNSTIIDVLSHKSQAPYIAQKLKFEDTFDTYKNNKSFKQARTNS